MGRAVARGADGGGAGSKAGSKAVGSAAATDEGASAAAGAGGGADADKGRHQVWLREGMRLFRWQGLDEAQVRRSGQPVNLGSFATAEEAALCVARSPEGKVAAERAAAAALPRPQLTREQALQQAGYANLTVLPSGEALQRARDAIIEAVALEIIYQAAEAAAIELGTEVATEVMAGIALGL